MDFRNIPLMNAMQTKLKYHSVRQAALAANVANADTPGYLARDIKAPDFKSMLVGASGASAMVATNPMHMQAGGGRAGVNGRAITRENTYELNPIGNNVSIEEEVMRVAENQSEYQKTLGIYRKSIEMFRIALGRPGSGG